MDRAAKSIPTLDDLLDFAEGYVRRRMLDDGEFMPMIHAVDGAGKNAVFALPDYGGLTAEQKVSYRAQLGKLMRDEGCIVYVLMFESWVTPLENVTPEIAMRLLSGAPPPEQEPGREEGVMLAAADAVGAHRERTFRTVRDAAGKVVDLQRRGTNDTHDLGGGMMRLLIRDTVGEA